MHENQRSEPGGLKGEVDLTTVCFLPARDDKKRQTSIIREAFSGMHRALDGGWMLPRTPA